MYFSTGLTIAEAGWHIVEEAEGFMREKTALRHGPENKPLNYS